MPGFTGLCVRKMLADHQRMSGYQAVGRKKSEILLLGLNQQDLVKRVFMSYWDFKWTGCMAWGHRQKNHVMLLQQSDNIPRIKFTFPPAGTIAGVKFYAHFPDRYGTYVELRISIGKNSSLHPGEIPAPHRQSVDIRCIEQDSHKYGVFYSSPRTFRLNAGLSNSSGHSSPLS